MMRAEKTLLNKAVSDKRGIVYPETERQRAAAAWLHAEGYGFWFAHASTPMFQLHANIKRDLEGKPRR